MWQGTLTRTYGKKGGLVVEMYEATGAPNPDRRAAKREAQEYLERAKKAALGGETLGISVLHSSYEPGNGRTGIKELVFG